MSDVGATDRRHGNRRGCTPAGRPRYSPITAQSIPIMMKKPVNIEMSAIAP